MTAKDAKVAKVTVVTAWHTRKPLAPCAVPLHLYLFVCHIHILPGGLAGFGL